MDATRSRFDSLMKERDLIERSILTSIKEHESLGLHLNDSLLDAQGFPRAEIDLYRVRSLRNSIARQQNDLKAIMKEIEQLLPQVIPAGGSNSVHFPSVAKNQPFARISVVPSDSFAFNAGLCTGDLIVKFGNLSSVKSLLDLKHEMNKLRVEGKSLRIELERNGLVQILNLDIQQVFGLGCEVKLLQ